MNFYLYLVFSIFLPKNNKKLIKKIMCNNYKVEMKIKMKF